MDKIQICGIRFIVSQMCNYNCCYCHNEWSKRENSDSKMNLDLVESLVDAAWQLGGIEADITGGEPFLEADKVGTILKSANKRGLRTCITTNGFYLDRAGSELIDNKLDEIHIHLPSLNQKKYSFITRSNTNLNKILDSVNPLIEKVGKIMLNIPIIPGFNDDEIPEFIHYFGKKGIIPRFIEVMPTQHFAIDSCLTIEQIVDNKIKGYKKTGEYLWGINKFEINGYSFETLRCICYDNKCINCQNYNFIHIDQNYLIKPCNLRDYRIHTSKDSAKRDMTSAYNFLKGIVAIPEEYKEIWAKNKMMKNGQEN